MPLPAEHLAALTDIVGAAAVRDAADLAARDPGVDPRNFDAGIMIRPAGTAEVARVLAYCDAARIGVVPQGGRTGLAGGAESRAGEVIVSLDRLNRIDSLDPVSRTVVCGAGVTLATLAAAAAEHGLAPGIDFGGRDSATLGGMVSTNAGGSSAFRYGTMRDRVLGLEVVLADGTVLAELGRVRKRNEGLALGQLFIGAEGTLGVVTRVALGLVAADGATATALAAVADLAAAVALADLVQRATSVVPTAIELMSGSHAHATCRAAGAREFEHLTAAPFLVLIEVAAATAPAAEDGLVALAGSAAERGLVRDAIVAQNEAQRRAMWRIREDWAVDRERPGGLWYDVSVPLAALPAYVAGCAARLAAHDPALELVVIGHLADGNLHLTVNAERPITERYEEVAPLLTDALPALGGSFAAEHGVGLEKQATLARLADPSRLALMRRLKAALDPHGIMNPGKVIPRG
jgi:FAD/FMN-containing dehydrogenase